MRRRRDLAVARKAAAAAQELSDAARSGAAVPGASRRIYEGASHVRRLL